MLNAPKTCRGLAFDVAVMFSLCLALAAPARASGPKFQVLHSFAGGTDGDYPGGSPLLIRSGIVLGVTDAGGTTQCYNEGCGVAFELSPMNGRWRETVLYDFAPGANEFVETVGPLVSDSQGNVYGSQSTGTSGFGEVYELTKTTGSWTEVDLHDFTQGSGDGNYPSSGLINDAAGNLYGATQSGGAANGGTMFELSPNQDGTWTYNLIYSFATISRTGQNPYGPLLIDATGNIYGTTLSGGEYGEGTVYKLTFSGGAWSQTTLFDFTLEYNQQTIPAAMVLDAQGNLYGVTTNDGAYGVGTLYELTPTVGLWKRTILHTFSGGADGGQPNGLVVNSAGMLLGVTGLGGLYGYGTAYEFQSSGGKWNETVLHAFTGGIDGAFPSAAPVLDQQGNLYGVAGNGGTYNLGTAFEITP